MHLSVTNEHHILVLCEQFNARTVIGFFDVSNGKTTVSLVTVIFSVLKDRNVDMKLETDLSNIGASVMAHCHGGIQAIINKKWAQIIIFIHCYAHTLNLVCLGAETIKKISPFVYDLTAFQTFFRKRSKRSELLREVCFKLPQANSAH